MLVAWFVIPFCKCWLGKGKCTTSGTTGKRAGNGLCRSKSSSSSSKLIRDDYSPWAALDVVRVSTRAVIRLFLRFEKSFKAAANVLPPIL